MKRLLTEQEYYKEEAVVLEATFRTQIEPLIDKYVKEGYATLDIGYILHSEIDRLLIFAKAYRDLGKGTKYGN